MESITSFVSFIGQEVEDAEEGMSINTIPPQPSLCTHVL